MRLPSRERAHIPPNGSQGNYRLKSDVWWDMFSSQEGMLLCYSILLQSSNIPKSTHISLHEWDDSMIIAHHDDNDDTKHVSFVLSCPSIVAPHVLGFWGVGSEGYYFLGERWVRTWSIHFDSGFQHLFNQFFSNWEAKFMLHFFTAILRITFMASRILKSICKSILLGKMSQPMNDGTSLDLLQSCYLRFGAAAMAVATLAEGCFNYVLRPCFNAVSYAAWLELCVFQKVGFRWVDEWFFSQLIFFLQKEVSANFIGLERKLFWQNHWSSWCCTFVNYWSWDSLVASFLLDFFWGYLDLPSQPTSKDSLWIHDINLFQTTTGLTSKPWVNTNQMLGVVRSIGKDAHFLKPEYCEWKFASDVYRHTRHTILAKWKRQIQLPYFFHTLQPWGFLWLDQCRINRSFGEL